MKRAFENPNSSWVKILDQILNNIKFTDLLEFGCQNPEINKLPTFYHNIILTWYSLKQNENPCSNEILKSSIWYNKNIFIQGKPAFLIKWYKNGIRQLKDIINKDGTFITKQRLKDEYGIESNFLTLLQLRMAIPLDWRGKLRNSSKLTNSYQGIYTIKEKQFIKLTQICSKTIYWELLTRSNLLKVPKAIEKWESTKIGKFNQEEWKQIFLTPVISCRSIRLQYFQYRILQRIITCNHWLYNAKIKDSPNCHCGQDDTLEHCLYECEYNYDFWQMF